MDTIVSATATENPLLQTLRARLPGETFRLPSQGLFYHNQELSDDVKDGEIHVFPITAIDEIILKTPDKLLSGKAIDEVFMRCIPQVKKPMELLSKDVDYLLMCLRLMTYGETLDITYTHDCEKATNCTYEVELRPLISQAKSIDPTSLGTLFVMTMQSDQKVELRPPLYGSIMKLYLSNFEATKSEDDQLHETQERLLDIISDTIVSVDSITDKTLIREWVREIPAGWMQQIGDSMQKLSDWGPSTSTNILCKDCGKEIKLEIPLNPVAFFS